MKSSGAIESHDDIFNNPAIAELSLTRELRCGYANHVRSKNAAVEKLSGWSLSSGPKLVWLAAMELHGYVQYMDSGGSMRCRRAKVGLFYEVMNIVLGLEANDLCICSLLDWAQLREVRITKRQLDVGSVCAEDLMNAAAYRDERRNNDISRCCSSHHERCHPEEKQVELHFFNDEFMAFAFSNPSDMNNFWNMICLVQLYHTHQPPAFIDMT